jgi:T-complex protein 1 subunit eta
VPQVSGERDFFAKMVVDAVTTLDPQSVDLRMLGIKKVQVGAASNA